MAYWKHPNVEKKHIYKGIRLGGIWKRYWRVPDKTIIEDSEEIDDRAKKV
jgi:hypothetical protein